MMHGLTNLKICVETVYALPLLPNNTAGKLFTQFGSGVKCSLDIQGVSGGTVNILGGGSMDYSE